ncbi:hypothetical protein [Pararhodobacter zhoushanensis]|uniref:hypothetical protein n=1 Tax=Pararhodobacter zhoushanensis TaxID=2479545 RepID=UPI000F8C9621|nr:hypothetical protein [Pararhodobacter zhoushanensis]
MVDHALPLRIVSGHFAELLQAAAKSVVRDKAKVDQGANFHLVQSVIQRGESSNGFYLAAQIDNFALDMVDRLLRRNRLFSF